MSRAFHKVYEAVVAHGDGPLSDAELARNAGVSSRTVLRSQPYLRANGIETIRRNGQCTFYRMVAYREAMQPEASDKPLTYTYDKPMTNLCQTYDKSVGLARVESLYPSFLPTEQSPPSAARADARETRTDFDAEEQDIDRNRWSQVLVAAGHTADRAHAFITEARRRKPIATPACIDRAVTKLAMCEAGGINNLVTYGLKVLAGEIEREAERARRYYQLMP